MAGQPKSATTTDAETTTENSDAGAKSAVDQKLEQVSSAAAEVTDTETETETSTETETTTETETEVETETEAETETETETDADQIKPGDIKGLTEQAQKAVNQRIAKVVKARKDAEEKAENAEQELTTLKSKLDGGFEEMVKKLGLHGDYVSKDEAKTLDKFDKLRTWKRWLATHRNGYEGDGEKDPAISSQEIAEREAAVDEQLYDLAGPAKTLWNKTLETIKADLAEGRKIRTGKTVQQPDPKKPPAKPPKLPGNGEGARRTPVNSGKTTRPTFDGEEFKKEGSNGSALEKQYRKIFGAE